MFKKIKYIFNWSIREKNEWIWEIAIAIVFIPIAVIAVLF